jgi:general stress protein YciG
MSGGSWLPHLRFYACGKKPFTQRRRDFMSNQHPAGTSDQRDKSGNSANDHDRASEAGRKAGQQSQGTANETGSGQHGGSDQRTGQQSQGSAHKGGQKASGNFADDPERASEAGRKGGQHSHSATNK